MTTSPDRTADLLVRVAEFLRKLPAEQLDALAAGEARLEVVPKGARVTGAPAKAKATVELAISVDQVEADLKSLDDRQAATQYLKDLKLKKPQLVELARALNVGGPASANVAAIIGRIVEQKVGYRLDIDAIMRG